jgi:hypothetical protein
MRAHNVPYAQGFYDSSGSSSGRYGDPNVTSNSGYAQQPGYSGYGDQQQPGYGNYGGQPPFGQPPAPHPQLSPVGSNSGRYNTNRPARYGQGVGRIRVWFPPGTDAEAIRAFEAGDYDGSGFIDPAELSRVISASAYIPFSTRTVNLMLHLFSNGNDKIGEFLTAVSC